MHGARRPGLKGVTVHASGSERVGGLAFWALAALCLLNLNGLGFLVFGVERTFSPVMLVCCVLTLTGLLSVRPREALGAPGALVLSSFAAYIAVGSAVSIVNGAAPEPGPASYVERYAISALVTAAAAVGGRVASRRIGGEGVLRRVLILMAASCAVILGSPWLPGTGPNVRVLGAERFAGAFGDPNAAALVATLTAAAALALLRSGRSRILAYGALTVALTAIVSTYSRTAIVILPVLMLSALLVTSRRQIKALAGGVAIVGLVLVGLGTSIRTGMVDERQAERLTTVVELVELPLTADVSLGERGALWRLGLERAVASPVVGNGLGSLHALEEAWHNRDGELLGVHNQFLILWGEAGFLPLLLFVAFLGMAFHAGAWKDRESWPLGLVSGWAVTLTLFSLSFHTVLTDRACNFLIGIACATMSWRNPVGRPPGEIPAGDEHRAEPGTPSAPAERR